MDLDPGSAWDERYRSVAWPSSPDPILVELVSPLRPGRALDLGCGPGRNAIWLAAAGWDVLGVDASEVALAQAQERACQAGVRLKLLKADIRTFQPEEGAFDLVVVANLHPAPGERAALFARAAEALAPGGYLFVVGHHLDNLGRDGPRDPERLYTEDLLSRALPEWLVIERIGRRLRPHDADEAQPDVAVFAWARRPKGA